MTRIAYLASEYPAPSHTFIRREIQALRRAGLDVVTFSIKPHKGRPASEQERIDCEGTQSVLGQSPFAYMQALTKAIFSRPSTTAATFRLALAHRAPGAKALVWALFHFVEAIKLADFLSIARVARLHSHFANSGATVGMLAAYQAKIPWSMTLHGVSETDYPAGLLLADKVRRADFVACASLFMRAQAMRVTDHSDWAKLHIVRCGIDPGGLPLPSASLECPITFICVGRLSSEKGHRILLQAFSHASKHMPGVRLDLVGDGPERNQIEALVKQLGLSESVALHGALSEGTTLERIAAADVLVLPSFMEGLPLVLIEAMALGKPVIASGVAGIPELVEAGFNGILVPPSDVEALADGMVRLALNSDERLRLGQAAQHAAMKEFQIQRAVLPLIKLFSESGN